ncbi:MAG TPA: beta-propeller fold lactonase family protein, partial [Mycobacterium sp.]|nr:beta-propeller fold lactonase family protein [Mycobacterium sp.]
LVFDPAGPYLYAGSNDAPTGTTEGFSVAAGILTPLNSQVTGNVAYSVAIDPANKFVWAPNVFDGRIAEFTLTAGVLSVPNYNGTLANPYAVAVHPTGLFVYVTDNTANVVQEFTYSASTGLLTATGAGLSTGAASKPTGIAIDPSGAFLYVSDSGTGKVSAFTINGATGALTAIAGSPFTASGTASPGTATALAVDPSSQFLYVANGDAGTISVLKITAATGVLTAINLAVPCIISGGGPQAIVVQ